MNNHIIIFIKIKDLDFFVKFDKNYIMSTSTKIVRHGFYVWFWKKNIFVG